MLAIHDVYLQCESNTKFHVFLCVCTHLMVALCHVYTYKDLIHIPKKGMEDSEQISEGMSSKGHRVFQQEWFSYCLSSSPLGPWE